MPVGSGGSGRLHAAGGSQSDEADSYASNYSWSPEGTFLAVPNSVNNGVFCAGILKRREWGASTSLIGHDNVIDVTVS
jgi:hypothetical protein